MGSHAKDWGPLRKTPLELIDSQIEYEYNQPFVYKNMVAIFGGLLGGGANLWLNLWSKRPVFSGMSNGILFADNRID